MSMGSIVGYVNIGLIVLFVLIIIGFLLSGLRGFIRGAWKSTHHMIFMLSLFTIAFVTLNALTDFIGTFPLSAFVKGSLYLSREIEGEVVTYYVPITNVHDTLTEFLKGFYTLYSTSGINCVSLYIHRSVWLSCTRGFPNYDRNHLLISIQDD